MIATPRRGLVILIFAWCAAMLLAFTLDRTIAEAIARKRPIDKQAHWVALVKAPGNYFFTLGLAALLAIFNPRRFHAALSLLISGALGGLLYLVIKWVAGRHRPVLGGAVRIDPWGFHPFPGGLAGFVQQSGLCFPSGHACLAFATAMTLVLALPRFGCLWFFLAAIVGGERVLENAHYLSDVIMGAGVGVLCGWLVWNVIQMFPRSDASQQI